MKGQYLSLIALLFTMGQLATAAEIEDSLKGDFLRDKNGFLITGTTQRQASDACARQGKRLPTAREIAFLGIRNGAALIEVNDYKANNIPSGSRITSFYIKKTGIPTFLWDAERRAI